MRKAKIIRYYQVVTESGQTIEDVHSYKQALKIKKDYEESTNK